VFGLQLVLCVPPGHLEAMRLLLSKGVLVDPINRRGMPLHLASAKGHDQIVKIILEHGADVSCYILSLPCQIDTFNCIMLNKVS
jgi:hypothetical protein